MKDLVTGLLDPYRFLFLVLGIGVAVLWRRRQVPARRLLPATLAFATLTLLSMPALAYLALGSLEWSYPPTDSRPAEAEAIVILGGGMSAPDAIRPRAEMNTASLSRCLHGAEVYRRGRPCPVVVCGGRIAPGPSAPPLAHLMREFLREHGLREADLVVEDQSRSTHENAVECRKLLDARGIGRVILVTDAVHMSRALRCFRKQGIRAYPSACHHSATEFEGTVWDFLPSADAVQDHLHVLHEWLGSAWYRINGYL